MAYLWWKIPRFCHWLLDMWWLYKLGYLRSDLMPFQGRQLIKISGNLTNRREKGTFLKCHFSPKAKHCILLCCLCLSATWQWEGKAQSYLCYALWLIPMWYTDCIMKLDPENPQMLLWATLPAVGKNACCLNVATMCFLCVDVGNRERNTEREPTGFS